MRETLRQSPRSIGSLLAKLVSPAVLLYIYLIFMRIADGFYVTAEFEPPPAFALIYSAGFLWIVGWWLLADSRKRGVPCIYDMGLFLQIAWPFVMPYYLLKTRGARGLLVILVFAATAMAATAVGAVLSLLFVPHG
ncbi:MAG TPA: hypothetical protein VGN90_13390 [Pyrinomonadaceae bacterium]|jgi:hypothetical protein|nr:hypothetical protein [Pyrinomonadaceae bacterium]